MATVLEGDATLSAEDVAVGSGADGPTPLQVGVLAVAVLLSAWAHLHRIGTTTALLDELTYQQSGIDAVRGTITAPAQPYLARHLFGLAQLLFGEGLPAARVVSAVASILTGVVLFTLGRRMAGWWAGVGALVLWSVLPQATRAPDGTVTMLKLGRSALLEPLMVLFVVLALERCWRWVETGRLRHAVLTGCALGAAVACKPTAGLLAPVLVVAALVSLGPSRRALLQVAVVAGAAAGVVLASYLPLGGEAPAAVRFMVEYQTQEHAAAGHPVIVAGEVHATAPWWSYGWWQWRSVGTVALVALLVGAVAALAVPPRRWITGLLAASIVVPFGYFSLVAEFGLPHYLHLWQPVLVLLAAVGVDALVRRDGPPQVLALALVLGFAVVGAQTLVDIATTDRLGYGAIGELVAERDLAGEAVVVWGQTLVVEHHLPGAQVVRNPSEATRPITAVIVDPGTVARDPRPEVVAYLAAEGSTFTRTEVDHLTLYLRD